MHGGAPEWYCHAAKRVFRYRAWTGGAERIVVFFPGHTLNESAFEQYAEALSPRWDAIAVHPFLHDAANPPNDQASLARHIASWLNAQQYSRIVLVGQSLGFHQCVHVLPFLEREVMHVFGFSPALIAHNLTPIFPVRIQRALEWLRTRPISRKVIYKLDWTLRGHSRLLLVRSLLGNPAYKSDQLESAIREAVGSRSAFRQIVIEPVFHCVNEFCARVLPAAFGASSITILRGRDDHLLRLAVRPAFCGEYYAALRVFLGDRLEEDIVLDGGHEGFLQNARSWIPVLLDRLERLPGPM